MDIKKYIASGILELYVAGTLSAEENLEVQHYALKHPEIQQEIEAIEATILQMTEAASPGMPKEAFASVSKSIDEVIPFTPESSKKRIPWLQFVGWAAAVLLAIGLFQLYTENTKLKTELEVTEQERQTLREQINEANQAIVEKSEKERLLNALRAKDISVTTLGGQKAAPESYAKVYWNKTAQKVYIDAQGLPAPPIGFTYQVWSLKLDPLTPTSIGLLDNFTANDTAVFELENTNSSEAFGITLEPEGGSESPNLEQLYTLGAVGR